MKKFICMLLCASLILLASSELVYAKASNSIMLLSDMSEDECIAFIKENGVKIPPYFENESEWGAFVKQAIIMYENNPNALSPYNHYITSKFFQEIGKLVNAYYDVDPSKQISFATTAIPRSESLQHSTVYGEWRPEYVNFNCYAFVYSYPRWLEPGIFHYISEDPLNRTTEEYIESFTLSGLNIEDIKDLVVKDLRANGYYDIHYSVNHMSTEDMCTNEIIFCVRMGAIDYHFMLFADGKWLHKPSYTQVLEYNYTPTFDRIWTNEAIFEGQYYPHTTEYTSDIYFISVNDHDWICVPNIASKHTVQCEVCQDSFTENCNLVYTSAGVNHHKATCADCGYTTPTQACTYSYTGNGDGTHERACTLCGNSMDLPCEMSYEYLMYNQHRAECTLCSDVIAEDCTAVATYCGNGSTNDIHSLACRDCGNAMSSATESCTLEYVFAGTVNGTNTHSRVCTECDYVKTASASCVYRLGDYCFFCGTHRDTQQTASLDDPNTKE